MIPAAICVLALLIICATQAIILFIRNQQALNDLRTLKEDIRTLRGDFNELDAQVTKFIKGQTAK